MINLNTGSHFREVAKKEVTMTRGGFLNGILASGIAPSITLAAFANAGSANASVGGMMRNVGGAMTAMFGGSGGWKNPYITDGLVSMWDGEYDFGGVKHGVNDTSWKDVVSGKVLTKTDSASFDLQNKCCMLSGGYWSGPNSDTSIRFFEVVIKPSSSNPSAAIVFSSRCNNFNNLMGRYNNWFLLSTSRKGFYYDSGISSYSILGKEYTDVYNATLYKNGSLTDVYAGDYFYPSDVGTLFIGTRSNLDRKFQGGVYCFRQYNRELTAEEVYDNYLVDKDRFNLP